MAGIPFSDLNARAMPKLELISCLQFVDIGSQTKFLFGYAAFVMR